LKTYFQHCITCSIWRSLDLYFLGFNSQESNCHLTHNHYFHQLLTHYFKWKMQITFNICVLKPYQWYIMGPIWTSFTICTFVANIWNYDITTIPKMGNHLEMLGFTFSHLWKHVWILGYFSNSIPSLCLSFGHKLKATKFDWIQIWLNINSNEKKRDANWWKMYLKSISYLHYLSFKKTTTWALNHAHWTQIFVHISSLTFILVNMKQ